MQVRDAMLAGQTGKMDMVRKRAIPKGGRDAGLSFFDVPSTYYYGKVPNSGFAYAFVLSSADHKFRRVRPTSSLHDPANTPTYTGTSYYHKVKDYSNAAEFPDRSADGPEAKLNLQPEPFIKGEFVSHVQSTFKVTPSSFCNPLLYQELEVAAGLTKAVHEAVNGAGSAADVECNSTSASGTLLRPWALTDVKLTQELQAHWLKRAQADVKDVAWTFIGMESGVFRTIPGYNSISTVY